MGTRMLQRKGTTAEWSAANPVLGDGELGYNRTTGEIRMGDGVTAWASLPSSKVYIPKSTLDALYSPLGAIPASLVDVAGDLLIGTADNAVGRLGKGTAGQVLTVTSDGSTLTWTTPIPPVPIATVDAAGDLIVGTGNDTVTRFAMGGAGQHLVVNPAGTGLAWQTPPSTDLSSTVQQSLIDAAGDLFVGTADNVVGRLAKGATGSVLNVKADGTVGWSNDTEVLYWTGI